MFNFAIIGIVVVDFVLNQFDRKTNKKLKIASFVIQT